MKEVREIREEEKKRKYTGGVYQSNLFGAERRTRDGERRSKQETHKKRIKAHKERKLYLL